MYISYNQIIVLRHNNSDLAVIDVFLGIIWHPALLPYRRNILMNRLLKNPKRNENQEKDNLQFNFNFSCIYESASCSDSGIQNRII